MVNSVDSDQLASETPVGQDPHRFQILIRCFRVGKVRVTIRDVASNEMYRNIGRKIGNKFNLLPILS